MASFMHPQELIKSSKETEIVNCNILGVKVATNGYCGGDSGHGIRTYFRLECFCFQLILISVPLIINKERQSCLEGYDNWKLLYRL